MSNEESTPSEFTLIVYSESGDPVSSSRIEIDHASLDSDPSLRQRLTHLSGDLDLPLEGSLAATPEPIVFRVSSDLQNSFTFYYCEDEIIGLSLTLLGGNVDTEADMIDSIRLLLLDQGDHDDPDDEQIDQILSSEKFAFHLNEERPAHCFMPFTPANETAQWLKIYEDMAKGDRQLASALCQLGIEKQ